MTAAESQTPPQPDDFTSREVVKLSGLTYRQLDYYVRHGWLPNHTTGSGHPRYPCMSRYGGHYGDGQPSTFTSYGRGTIEKG